MSKIVQKYAKFKLYFIFSPLDIAVTKAELLQFTPHSRRTAKGNHQRCCTSIVLLLLGEIWVCMGVSGYPTSHQTEDLRCPQTSILEAKTAS